MFESSEPFNSHFINLFKLFSHIGLACCCILSSCYVCYSFTIFHSFLPLSSSLDPASLLPIPLPSLLWCAFPVYNILPHVVNQPVGPTPHWSLPSPSCPGWGQTLGACWFISSESLPASPPLVAHLVLLLPSTLSSGSSSLLCLLLFTPSETEQGGLMFICGSHGDTLLQLSYLGFISTIYAADKVFLKQWS